MSQRRRAVNPAGRRTRLVALLVIAMLGCDASPRDPTRFLQPGDGTGQVGTGGATSALVGSWRVFLVVSVATDIQSWITTWSFAADGTCHFRREVRSLAEGSTRLRERDCTWTTSGGTLTATFTDTGEIYPMPWSFASLGTTTLTLEGVAYQRVGG